MRSFVVLTALLGFALGQQMQLTTNYSGTALYVQILLTCPASDSVVRLAASIYGPTSGEIPRTTVSKLPSEVV